MQVENGNVQKGFYKLTLIFGIVICTFALAIAGLGIWLIYLKSTGITKLKFFGQEFSSNNVGIAAIFIGGVILVLALRRILRSLDKIADNYVRSQKDILDYGKHTNASDKRILK